MTVVNQTLERPFLVGRRVDPWLTGWVAVVLWVGSSIAGRAGHPLGSLGLPYYWPAAALSAMHFGMTYRLAYAEGAKALRRRPLALVVGPAVLAVALGGIVVGSLVGGVDDTRRAAELAILSVFLLTTWHYIKQVYGVVRIAARYRNITLTVNEAKVLRFGLYPLWFVGASFVLTKGGGTRTAGFSVGLDLLPIWADDVFRALGLCCAVVILFVLVTASRRVGVLPPSTMVAPYLAAVLWLAVPTDIFGSFLALGALHGVQYLACCYRAETGSGTQPLSRSTVLRWVEILGGAACGGLLLTMWLPQLLDRTVNIVGAPLLFTGMFFVFLNLHHYLVDAVLWRSRGEVVRAMTTSSPVGCRNDTGRVGESVHGLVNLRS